MPVDNGGRQVDELAVVDDVVLGAGSRMRRPLVDGWRSIRMPLARSMVARRPNAPSRRWYSAKRRRTMSIELCQSSTSASLMWAKTPRLEASFRKSGSARGEGRSPGRRLPARSSRSGPAHARSLAEPDEATSGRSLAVTGADVCDLDLARDHLVPECDDDRGDERQPSFRSLAIRTRRCSVSRSSFARRSDCVNGV